MMHGCRRPYPLPPAVLVPALLEAGHAVTANLRQEGGAGPWQTDRSADRRQKTPCGAKRPLPRSFVSRAADTRKVGAVGQDAQATKARDRCNGRSSPRGSAAPRNGCRSSPWTHQSPFIARRHHRPLSQARLPAAGPGATSPAIIFPWPQGGHSSRGKITAGFGPPLCCGRKRCTGPGCRPVIVPSRPIGGPRQHGDCNHGDDRYLH